MLQTIGFLRRAIAMSLMQEGTILAAAASLIATVVAVAFVNGVAVRFTMGAFALQVDSLTLLVGVSGRPVDRTAGRVAGGSAGVAGVDGRWT